MLANSSSGQNDQLSLQKEGITAFEELYKTYWYSLYCIARKQTSSSPDAEELVQNLFEKIWKNRDSLVVRNWGPFLVISLRNLIIDFHRRQAVQKKLLQQYQPAPVQHLPEEEFNKAQLQELVIHHLQELPRKTREIFTLSRFEHKSVKEIAGSMQLTEKAVEYHITKSLRLLRHHLRNYLPFIFFFF